MTSPELDPSTQIGAFRAEIEKRLDADLMQGSELAKVLHLAEIGMGLVSQPDGSGKAGAVPENPMLAYTALRAYLDQPDVYGGICGHMQIFAAHLFYAFGIPSRSVAMFEDIAATDGTLHGHASTDVMVEGEWMAVDLTFGFYFQDRLSWPQARARYLAGQPVQTIKIGSGRVDLENYYIGLAELVPFMLTAQGPAGDQIQRLGEKSGQRWDGWLHYGPGKESVDWLQTLIGVETGVHQNAGLPAQTAASETA